VSRRVKQQLVLKEMATKTNFHPDAVIVVRGKTFDNLGKTFIPSLMATTPNDDDAISIGVFFVVDDDDDDFNAMAHSFNERSRVERKNISIFFATELPLTALKKCSVACFAKNCDVVFCSTGWMRAARLAVNANEKTAVGDESNSILCVSAAHFSSSSLFSKNDDDDDDDFARIRRCYRDNGTYIEFPKGTFEIAKSLA
jgi:hypothetical protein